AWQSRLVYHSYLKAREMAGGELMTGFTMGANTIPEIDLMVSSNGSGLFVPERLQGRSILLLDADMVLYSPFTLSPDITSSPSSSFGYAAEFSYMVPTQGWIRPNLESHLQYLGLNLTEIETELNVFGKQWPRCGGAPTVFGFHEWEKIATLWDWHIEGMRKVEASKHWTNEMWGFTLAVAHLKYPVRVASVDHLMVAPPHVWERTELLRSSQGGGAGHPIRNSRPSGASDLRYQTSDDGTLDPAADEEWIPRPVPAVYHFSYPTSLYRVEDVEAANINRTKNAENANRDFVEPERDKIVWEWRKHYPHESYLYILPTLVPAHPPPYSAMQFDLATNVSTTFVDVRPPYKNTISIGDWFYLRWYAEFLQEAGESDDGGDLRMRYGRELGLATGKDAPGVASDGGTEESFVCLEWDRPSDDRGDAEVSATVLPPRPMKEQNRDDESPISRALSTPELVRRIISNLNEDVDMAA
ncbi:hypothetical protein HDU93_001435, partial [Gonapodya sp. JEL0774]